MPHSASDVAEQFELILNSPKQTWLLAAGASYLSNVPLMIPLTEKTLKEARTITFADDAEALQVIDYVENDIEEDAHIEIFLTHLTDLISLAQRSRSGALQIAGSEIKKVKLTEVHNKLLEIIANIIRWGYRPELNGQPAEEGKVGSSIVKVEFHKEFIQAVFRAGRAGLENLRGPIEFFTTNYDTLIEDALALNKINFDDPFVGGGLGFWSGYEGQANSNAKAVLTKLHGSIDWYRPIESPSPLLRVRHGDRYPGTGGAVMIYPQATKYMTSQLDPFSTLFSRFRCRLSDGRDHVLMICGYSFGDDHINEDIEIALSATDSQLSLIAFSGGGQDGFPDALDDWRKSSWGDRIYTVCKDGLYRGNEGPFFKKDAEDRHWWTFSGATSLMQSGLPADIREEIQ